MKDHKNFHQPLALQNFKQISISILLYLLFIIRLSAETPPFFTEGASVYVVAQSGLTLRELPDIKSRALEIINFGDVVTVLEQPDSITVTGKINWVEGRWIKVDYDGVQGYVFDGYLSDLPLPEYDFEICHMDLDLIYPLESWADRHLVIDTTLIYESKEKERRVTQYLTSDKKVLTFYENNTFTADLYISDIRIMDAYHLLYNMIDNKRLQKEFKDQSIFITDADGLLTTIKINIDQPVKIRKLKSGRIKISITGQNYQCME